jgi:hypothetical protein
MKNTLENAKKFIDEVLNTYPKVFKSDYYLAKALFEYAKNIQPEPRLTKDELRRELKNYDIWTYRNLNGQTDDELRDEYLSHRFGDNPSQLPDAKGREGIKFDCDPSGDYDLVVKVKHKLAQCCPVCNGNGLVPNGFYAQTSGCWSTNSTTPEKCQSCKGTGYVWIVDPSEQSGQ